VSKGIIERLLGGLDGRERTALVDGDGRIESRGSWAEAAEAAAGVLRAAGIREGHVVGLCLSGGPALATMLLSTMDAAVALPLRPDLPAGEIERLLVETGAVALLTDDPDRVAGPAAAAGVPLVDVDASPLPGRLDVDALFAVTSTPRVEEPVALLLHTSGTTARPKQVPLTVDNLLTSAANVASTLDLSPEDSGLLVMPLFHIHGAVAGLLAPLLAGGQVVVTTGFDAPSISGWLTARQPTWYTAVPTMHQAVLDHTGDGLRHSLRLVRSSSSALPLPTAVGLEARFGVPVVEAYGMTEAAHQMTCTPLDGSRRRVGSVGPAAGPEVAVLGPDRRLAGPGVEGEVVIRGANVTSGYLNPPGANDEAFVDGWFRTGDQGRLDADGHLYLTGRLKELILRGGENIAPAAVDAALLEHPEVARALAFGVPDPRLGEQVAALVVLRPDATATPTDLRRFVAERLAPHEVPRLVRVVDELPLGPTGKPQRIGLAERLGLHDLDGRDEQRAPRPADGEVERYVAGRWADVLGAVVDDANLHFLDAGGDSVTAMRLLGLVRDDLGLAVPMVDFFDAVTVAGQAQLLEDLLLDGASE
jgi:oxalate---CoA ligase